MKKEYGGGPVFIYRATSSSVDLETGTRTVTKEVFKVPKAIILPAKIIRDVTQTISMISANKAFVVGGYYDSRTRMFIIQRDDVSPPLTELKEDYWFVFNGKKYELKSIQEFEYDMAWVVIAKQLLGDIPEQIHEMKVDNLVNLVEAADGS